MLTVLGGLAEFQRHLILARTNEGREGEGQGRQVWEEAEAHSTSTPRSLSPTRGRRGLG